jgi:hypothetical protein
VHIADVNLVHNTGATVTSLHSLTSINKSDMVQLTGVAAVGALNGASIAFIS